MKALKVVKWIIAWKKIDFVDLVKDAESVADFSPSGQFRVGRKTSHKHGLASKAVLKYGSFRSRFFLNEFFELVEKADCLLYLL